MVGSVDPAGVDSTSLTDNLEIRQEMIRLINQTRKPNGVSELPVNEALMNAAQACSDRRYTWHHAPEESKAAADAGYPYGFGDNLTVFTGTADAAQRAVDNWINSPGHFQTMIDPRWDILSRLDDSELARFEGAYGLKKEGYRNDESDLPDGMPSIVTVEVPVRDEKYGFRTVYLAYLHWNPNEASSGYMEGVQIAQDYQGVTAWTTQPDGVLKWQDSAGNAYTMPLNFRFDTDNAGTACYYANFSLPKDVSGPTEGFLFWEATPTLPEIVSLYNFSVTAAHKRSCWQYPYTLPSELLASGFHAPNWQWRMYQWTSEGQMAPEGQYDSRKY